MPFIILSCFKFIERNSFSIHASALAIYFAIFYIPLMEFYYFAQAKKTQILRYSPYRMFFKLVSLIQNMSSTASAPRQKHIIENSFGVPWDPETEPERRDAFISCIEA